ncbi:uncharacterized protein LOC110460752 [Mizuhopecten yessoensis]|uniref:uncharacterized protein LOC110460752 n=1 Tax=Mizuhopecten yessoensis TaxID=6573 RepID=UPI000B45D1E4|nr:uncharacterized protein LOC110460752 [Mizuhopecten yessoensis]
MPPDTNVVVMETKENGHSKNKWKTIIEIIGLWYLTIYVINFPDFYENFMSKLYLALFVFMVFYSHKESFPGSSFGILAYCWMALKAVCFTFVFTTTWYNWHYTLMGLTLMELIQLTFYEEIRKRRCLREVRDNTPEKGAQEQSETIHSKVVVYKNTIQEMLPGVHVHIFKVKFFFICLVLLYVIAPYTLYTLIANIPSIMFAVIIIFTHIHFFSEKPLIDFILYCCVISKYVFYLKDVFTLQMPLELQLLIISTVEYFQLHVSQRVQEWLCDRKLVKCKTCSDSTLGAHRSSKKGRIQSELHFIEELFLFCVLVYVMLNFGLWGIVTVRDIFLVVIPLLIIAYSAGFLVVNKNLLSLKYYHVVCVHLSKCFFFANLWYWHYLPKCLVLLSLIEIVQVRVIGYYVLEKKAEPALVLCDCQRFNKCIICLVWYLMPYTYYVDFWRLTSCPMTSYLTSVDASRVTSYMRFVDAWYIYKKYKRCRHKHPESLEEV